MASMFQPMKSRIRLITGWWTNDVIFMICLSLKCQNLRILKISICYVIVIKSTWSWTEHDYSLSGQKILPFKLQKELFLKNSSKILFISQILINLRKNNGV